MKKNRKVLIVDDEPNIVMTLDYLFRRQGYAVFLARDGAEAIGLLEEEVPDLIMLDIMMPKVDGYEVCRHVRATERLAHAKVVFMSAKGREADIQKGLSLGANLYIRKPFSTRELMKKVKALFDPAA
ncbi:MAG: response regulator [Bacteroidota bacterium]